MTPASLLRRLLGLTGALFNMSRATRRPRVARGIASVSIHARLA